MTDDAFDDIVAGFYRAACGAISWNVALVPFQRAMAAVAVSLRGVDLHGRVAFAHVAGDGPVALELDDRQTDHSIDPRARVALDRAPGVSFDCREVPDADFVADESSRPQVLFPNGGRQVSRVELLQDESVCVTVGVDRGVGAPPLDAARIDVGQRLVGHLTAALRIHQARLRERRESRLGLEVLNRLRTPVVLIDDGRRVRQANGAARALLASDGAVFERDGRLCCRRPRDDRMLLDGLKTVLTHDATAEDGGDDETVFVHARASATDRGIGLYLDAVRNEDALPGFGDRPAVMVTFHDPRSHLELDARVVATAFDLTPAEARVAVAIAEGASPDHIATRHAASIHTVRSQLQTILQKTGTTRQAEMVGMLAGLPTTNFCLEAHGDDGQRRQSS